MSRCDDAPDADALDQPLPGGSERPGRRHAPGSWNTTTSPRWMPPSVVQSRQTRIRSPGASVGSIEPLGTTATWTRKLLMRRATSERASDEERGRTRRRRGVVRAGRSARRSAASGCRSTAVRPRPAPRRASSLLVLPRSSPAALGLGLASTARPRPRPRGRRLVGASSSVEPLVEVLGLGRASAACCGGLHRGELRVVDPTLLDPGLLPAQVAQVVELRAADPAALDELELRDRRRVQRERALHADPERDLADREGLAHAAAGAPDDDALEDLDALAVPLDHADVHLHGVTGAERGEIRAQERLLDQIGRVHGNGRRVYQRPSGRPDGDVTGACRS